MRLRIGFSEGSNSSSSSRMKLVHLNTSRIHEALVGGCHGERTTVDFVTTSRERPPATSLNLETWASILKHGKSMEASSDGANVSCQHALLRPHSAGRSPPA